MKITKGGNRDEKFKKYEEFCKYKELGKYNDGYVLLPDHVPPEYGFFCDAL